jgi:hypothetical protein
MQKLFDKISDKEKDLILKEFEAETLLYKKNSSVLSTNRSNIIGIVLEGYLQIIKTDYDGKQVIIEELPEGHLFGTTLSNLNNNEVSILAKEDSKVLVIEYSMIFNSNNVKPYISKFLKNLLDITTDIINERNNHIQILTKRSIRDKLLEYFNLNKTPGSKILYLPSTITDLANYLAIDRSAMSRELKNLRDDGFIETKGKRIYLKY